MTFDKAEIACEMSFYELISINNAFENAYVACNTFYVYTNIVFLRIFQILALAKQYLSSYDYFWIGLTRKGGIWHWEDKSHVTYTNWGNGRQFRVIIIHRLNMNLTIKVSPRKTKILQPTR